MQSLLDLYNMREGKQPGSDLLEFYQGNGQAHEPQVIDRATFLPIGQYEDGSLTLAWPGFMKDAYEGAVRSFEQGRQLPRADEEGYYAGTPRAEPLDAFNAASLAPIAGVGMRAAGLADDGVRGVAHTAEPVQGVPTVEQAKGIRAYHGSPHDFDKFRMSKVGTGEGNQTYGRGLYFAESEDVARSYREELAGLAGFDVGGRRLKVPINGPAVDAFAALERAGGNTVEALKNVRAGKPREILEKWAAAGVSPVEGRMYEVKINAEPSQFLDWASLPRGRQLALQDPDVVAELQRQGVPGVRYLDQGSRAAGAGTHNYVVWDDSLIDIARKYANPTESSLPYLMTNALEQAASDAPKGIRAYHGSLHDFDKFDLAQKGTGEGGSTYGVGANLSASEDYARMYREPDRPWDPQGGHMYEVNINADRDALLDWDKPITEQSPAVKSAVDALLKSLPSEQSSAVAAELRRSGDIRKTTGSQLMWALDRAMPGGWVGPNADFMNVGPNANVSAKLKEAGIPGIRYVENWGDNPENYTIFDDSLINIIRKYANPETASLPYLMTNGMEGDDDQMSLLRQYGLLGQ